jgi:eukaryotic-like serine/threonine-protein kinase
LIAMSDEPHSDLSAVDSFLRDAAAVSEPAASEHPPLRLKAGEVLSGRFTVERLAGSGGMGAVYRALDRVTGVPVALKVMTTHGKHAQRFAQEARVLAELNHPAIVRYVAHGETEQGQPYLAMEWLAGEDLAQRLATSRLTVGESLDVARRVAQGLAAAHARGLVHRDVKPSNVLLVEGQPARATLLDFGIARTELSATGPTAAPMTGTGIVLGTVGYMSPEQAIGDKTLDARADVFALGCLLFECLTGRTVFSGDHVVAVLAKVLREEAPRVRVLRPDLPEALDALVARMLSKDRTERPPHGDAVTGELEALGQLSGAAPATMAHPVKGVSGSEQRMTTVLLAVVAGEPIDVSDVVRRHGGDLARLANGALLVTFGGRGPASEQVVVAASCALEVLDVLPAARIALATGRALTTAGGLPGPVIDQAASLLVHSEVPGIQIDETTSGLLGDRFEVRLEDPGRSLVGKHVEVDHSRTLLGKATPFVGRDKELALLEATLQECVEEAVSRSVLVTGPAGQGKSRLRREFVRKALARGDVRVLAARADPVGAGSSFMMVRQLVRAAAGLREMDPAPKQHDKLRTHVASVCKEPSSARIADFLGELLAVPSSETPSPQLRAARNDPMIMAVWVARSFGDWLAAECDAQPLLVVLEDLHWGDAASVTFLGGGLRSLASKPFMVLALGRPGVRDAFPNLWAGAERSEVLLGRLAPRAAERLARAALGPEISEEVLGRIVERADGNAFYLEELIRRVAEGGADTLPETVLALVQARLGQLETGARRAVRAASVFGEVFWRGGVAALLGGGREGGDIDGWLRELAEREIVSVAHDCRYPGESEFTFRHSLLREAAYAMLTDDDRTTGHRLAGGWLERAGEKDSLTMADHYERGGEPARAVPWLIRAAESAFDGGNMDMAENLVQRGIACDPEPKERDKLLAVKGNVLYMRGDWLGTATIYHSLMNALPVGSTAWFSCAAAVFASGDPLLTAPVMQAILMAPVQPEPSGPYGVAVHWTCTALSGIGQEALAWSFLERAEGVEKSVPDPDPVFVVWQWVSRGELLLWRGELGGALAAFATACDLADRVGVAAARATAEVYTLIILLEAGHWVRAEAAATATLGLHAEWTEFYLTSARLETRHPGALDALRSLLSKVNRNPALTLAVRGKLALALIAENDLDGAVREADAVLQEQPGFTMATAMAFSTLARVAFLRNRPDEALAFADCGLAVQGSRLASTVSLLYVVRADALHALERKADANAAISHARDRILDMASTLEDPELRESFVTNVAANARTLELARERLGPGISIA